MIDIASGHAAIDRYLADGYLRVRGMSSRFTAAICGHLIRRQTARGIGGDIAEIGAFEGRFFIAMALGWMIFEPWLIRATDMNDRPLEEARRLMRQTGVTLIGAASST